jgi:hypothetical protein
MFPASLSSRKTVPNVKVALVSSAYRRPAASVTAAAHTIATAIREKPVAAAQVRFAAGPSRDPADNFARRKATRNNIAAMPAILQTTNLDIRPQATHTTATIGIFLTQPITLLAAIQFWNAWLKHPTLQSLTVYVTPTAYGSGALADPAIALITGFWTSIYECLIGGELSPALQRLRIEIPSLFWIDSIGATNVLRAEPAVLAALHCGEAARCTLAASILFSTIGSDCVGYKYRLQTDAAFRGLQDVALPACFLTMESSSCGRPHQEMIAEGLAVARTLRVLFPAAVISADPFTVHIPETVEATMASERVACIINLRDMKLGKIRRIWTDLLQMLDEQ